ncbi:RND family transporter [Chloroflexota bacterium]
MEKLGDFVYRRFRLILAVVILFNLASALSFIRFDVNTDFISFFSQDNPATADYYAINEKYQSGEAISVLVESDTPLLDKDNLGRVHTLQEGFKAVPGVAGVQSFLPAEIVRGMGTVPVDAALIESSYQELADFIRNRYFMAGQFLADDGHTGSFMVNLEPGASGSEVAKLLEEATAGETILRLSFAGNPVIKNTLSGYFFRILVILIPCAVVLILAVFYLIIRDRRLTILALIPAWLATLWTFGTLFWSGRDLNLVTILSPIFILVIGSAYGLHYVTHYQDNIAKYRDRQERTVNTMRMVGMPIMLAALTTMAGFISLSWAEVIPMRDMGIFVTLGIGYAGLLALVFLPALLSRLNLTETAAPRRESRLAKLVLAASRQRLAVIIVFVAVAAVSGFFIPRLEVVSDQLMFFKEGSDIRQTFAKVETAFGGAVPLSGELANPAGLEAIADAGFARRALATERELEALPGIRSVVSIFDLAQGINYTITGNNEYPENPMVLQGVLAQLGEGELGQWLSEDGAHLLIRTENLSGADIAGLKEYVAGHNQIRVVTGMPLLFDEMNRLVVRSQVQSLGLALGLIFLMLLVTLRRPVAAIVAMIPILLTIAATLGMLALSGFNLNIVTANLSAIAIGVGVDYAVHLIAGVQFFRNEGQDGNEATVSALRSISRPVLANAAGLAIGLSVLFFSPLQIHFQAASVMWVAMVVSSLAALLLIPSLYRGSGR